MSFEVGCKELFEAWNAKYNRAIQATIAKKSHLPLRDYIYRLYYYSSVLEQLQHPLPKKGGDPKALNKGRNAKMVVILLLLSAILVAHHWIPAGQETFSILGMEVGSFGFLDTTTFMFYASNKLVLFALGLIWFVTSKAWWRWAILAPVLFYFIQFWEVFQPIAFLESEGNLTILPLVLLTISVVILFWILAQRISETRDNADFLKRELEQSIQKLSREEAKRKLFQMKVWQAEIL